MAGRLHPYIYHHGHHTYLPRHSQVEGLVVFGSPVVALGLGGELPLLVTQMRSNHSGLHEGSEHAGRLPLEIIRGHHWQEKQRE